MSYRGYASTSGNVRAQLEALTALPDDGGAWLAFLRRETTLPAWLLPAFQVAVRQLSWRAATDPVAEITYLVRRIAIEMKLSGANKVSDLPEPE